MENNSSSNLKQLMTYFVKNSSANFKELVDYYTPSPGYIYCLYNEVYEHYGEDVYKFGNSSDPDKRLLQYTTSYIRPSELIKISNVFLDKNLAETLLFNYLINHRIAGNREFFKCGKELINFAFEYVDDFFKKYSTKQLLIEHLLENNVYLEYYSVGNTKENVERVDKTKKYICELLNITDNEDTDFVSLVTQNLINMKENEFATFYKNNYGKFLKYKFVLDRINVLFLFEREIKFDRFMITNIENIDLDKIKLFLVKHIEQIFYIFKNDEAKNKTIKSIKHKIKTIENVNYLQKFVAECYNKIIDNIIDVKSKRVRMKDKILRYYTFKVARIY